MARESDQFVASEAAAGDTGGTARQGGHGSGDARVMNGERPWLGINFTCAGAYVRVYRNAEGTAYLARCPKCGECTRFRVGPEGNSGRFYEVRCDR